MVSMETMSPSQEDSLWTIPLRIRKEIAHLKGKATAVELAERFTVTIDMVNEIWLKTKDRIQFTFMGMNTIAPADHELIIFAEGRVKKTLPNGIKVLDNLRLIHAELHPRK